MKFFPLKDQVQKNKKARWMVSYSDFTTVLLALFMVLTVSSNVKVKELENVIKKENPEVYEKLVETEEKVLTQKEPEAGMNLLLQGVKNPSNSTEITVFEFEKIAKDLSGTEGIEIIEEKGGLTIRIGESLLFDTASAEIKPQSKKTLDKIANVLTKNKKQIRIEGHSDNIPIKNSKYESNWELSSARASKIANYLIEVKKMDKYRFTVSGLADTKPIGKNSSTEGRSKNRRVDIIVVN